MKVIGVAAGFALVVSLAACNKEVPADAAPVDASAAPKAAQVEAVPSTAAVPVTLVAGNVPLKFPHSVRANLESTDNGVTSHTLRIEYQESDEVAVAEAIVSAFKAQGYVVKTDGVKNLAINDAGKVRYTIVPAGPDLKVKLSSPDSKGLVTFIW